MSLGDTLTVDASVPLAETNFGQLGFHFGYQPEPSPPGSRRSRGPAQVCHVEGVDTVAASGRR